MTTKELLQHQFDDAGYQLNKVYEGIEDPSLDCKLTDQAMTPRELLSHLIECYVAAIKTAGGSQHEWGTYQVADTSWPAIWNEFESKRKEATAVALNAEGWESHAHAYIIAHDYYHVGQMCLVRLARDPGWDGYSIYKSE